MELHVFAVHDAGTGPVGRRQSIPGGAGRVGGVQVQVAQATCGQEGALGQGALHLAGGGIEQEGAMDADGVRPPAPG